MTEIVWEPTPERVEEANLTRLIRKLGCADYAELHRISVQDPVRFWPAVIGIAVLLLAIKIVTNAAASLVFRWSVPGSIQLGFLLAQGSEFAFVIFSLPAVRILVGETQSAVLIAAVALSLAVTPTLAEAGRSLAGRMRRRAVHEADPELQPRDLAGPVFIAGMGRTGRTLADALSELGIAYGRGRA